MRTFVGERTWSKHHFLRNVFLLSESGSGHSALGIGGSQAMNALALFDSIQTLRRGWFLLREESINNDGWPSCCWKWLDRPHKSSQWQVVKSHTTMAIADQTTSTNSQHQDQERSWHLRAPDVEAVELLYHPGGSVESFPLPGRADDLQLLPGGELLLELLVHLLGQLGEVLGLVLDEAESVLGQRVQHVQAVDLVTLQIFDERILCLLRIHILFSFSICLSFTIFTISNNHTEIMGIIFPEKPNLSNRKVEGNDGEGIWLGYS